MQALNRMRPWALIALAIFCGGCSEGLPLAPVSGVVTLDGKPVKGALLEFVPQQPGGSTSYGTTDENGRYKMYFGTSETGAFIGKSLVRITSDDRVSIAGKELSGEIFPRKYNTNSQQFVEIAKGSNEFDFKCESDGTSKPRTVSGGGT